MLQSLSSWLCVAGQNSQLSPVAVARFGSFLTPGSKSQPASVCVCVFSCVLNVESIELGLAGDPRRSTARFVLQQSREAPRPSSEGSPGGLGSVLQLCVPC